MLRPVDDQEMDRLVDAWMPTRSAAERSDPIWKLAAYRVARYEMHSAAADTLAIGEPGSAIADQLLRSVASVSSNISEGYARRSYAQQALFYSYALGSVREAVSWYSSLEQKLGERLAAERIEVLSRARRLLFGLLKSCHAKKGQRIPGM
jgi:four helix bundle protein